jgi:hypothetical protein
MLFQEIRMMSEEEINIFYTQLVNKKMKQNCKVCGQGTRLFSVSEVRGNVTTQLRCTFNKCKNGFSIWHDTIFINNKVSHIKTIKVINLLSIGASARLIKNILGIELWEVKEVYRALRKFDIHGRYMKSIKPIGGENIVAEIGKNKYHADHLIKGFWALGW